MEMERIDENTFLFRIKNEDLKKRGTSMTELLSNPGDIEEFFHSILVEMDVIDQFEDTVGLSFQVMPNAHGLELYVTRFSADDAEEMDMNDGEAVLKNIVNSIQHSLGHRLQQREASPRRKSTFIEIKDEPEENELDETFYFNDFEDFVALAKDFPFEVVESTLYRYEDAYFLHVKETYGDLVDVSAFLAILMEYAELSRISWEVLEEYGQVMIAHTALQDAKKYFK